MRQAQIVAAALAPLLLAAAMAGVAQSPAGGGDSQRSASNAAPGELEQIVVTAERRTETLQKSSVALQVLSGEDLEREGIVGPKDLTLAVPGLAVGAGGPAPQYYIRGVGDLSAIALSNPAIATNLDGVYVARPTATNANFYDLARVEVLKGPQGTLYGRNASGGAINVISNKPILDNTSGYLTVEGGNFSEMKGEGAINIPVAATLAVRAAFQVVDRKGYLSDGFDDDRHQAVRLEGLWQPSSDVSLLLEGDVAHMGGKGGGFVYLPRPARSSPWEGITSPASNAYLNSAVVAAGLCAPASAFPPTVAPPGACLPLVVAPGVALPQVALFSPLDGSDEHQNNVMWGVHAEFNWDLDFATLTLIPAYRSTSENYTTYPAYPFYQNPSVSHETTFETRLAHNEEHLKWVGGLYFYNESQEYTSGVDAGLVQNARYDVSPQTRSYAAFGQLTYSLLETWRIIAGARFTTDERQITGTTSTVYPAVSTNPAAVCLNPTVAECLEETFHGSRTFRNVSWKGGTEYDLTSHSMLYLTAGTGFKAGGLNQNTANSPPGTTQAQPYSPEKLLAFELGSRNRFLNERLQVNVEAFYWIYKDHQEPHVLIDSQGNAAFQFSNAGRATLYGVDPDITFLATRQDKLHLLGEYLQSQYSSFQYLSAFPVATGCSESHVVAGYQIDCSGFQMAHAAKWSGSFGYEHDFLLAHDATLAFNLDAQYASWRWLAIEFTPAERAPGYLTENTNLTYTSGSGQWALSAYIRNITDRAVYTSGSANAFGPETFAATIGAPRTFGASIRWKF
jgi:iron complex outermembrane recepter protein